MEGNYRDPLTTAELKHHLTNQLGIAHGFLELVIEETPDTDRRRRDLLEVRKAMEACLALLNRMSD